MIARGWIFLVLGLGSLTSAGCARWHAAPALPSHSSVVLDQLVIFSDSPLPQHHRLLEDLKLQRSQLSTKLALKISDEPIHVYLFPTAEKLESYMRVHYPALPKRRAFFVESDTRLSVYAYWGDRVAEDLRHEVAHGYLHAVVPHLPLWLDEGLAEFFEVPRGQDGMNRPHVEQLMGQLSRGWQPSLKRLEALEDTDDLAQEEYAESWAWVYFLLESSPERREVLRSYLQALGKTTAVETISEHLMRFEPDCEQKFVEYIKTLDQSLR